MTSDEPTEEEVKAAATRPDLAIVTNALTTAMQLVSRPNLKVIITGGVLRTSSYEAVGVILTLILLGRLLETKAKAGTGEAIRALTT